MNSLKYKKTTIFEKKEIHKIMELYSKKISIGEWKDYSISFNKEYAIFSIYRTINYGSSFQIKKIRQKNVFVLTHQNKTLTISNSLNNVVNYLKKPNLRIIK
jgi:hypothetical protein